MTLDELIDRADAGYPDGLVAACWDASRQAVIDDHAIGDTLALFIARELKDTFDPEAPTADQLAAAAKAIQRAINEMVAVRDALSEEPACRRLIQRVLTLHDSIFVSECAAVHDMMEYDTLLSDLKKLGYTPVSTLAFVRDADGDEDA